MMMMMMMKIMTAERFDVKQGHAVEGKNKAKAKTMRSRPKPRPSI